VLVESVVKKYEPIVEKLVFNILIFAVFKEAAAMQFTVFELPPHVLREMSRVHMNVPRSFDVLRRNYDTT
jgi:hypothetical protein